MSLVVEENIKYLLLATLSQRLSVKCNDYIYTVSCDVDFNINHICRHLKKREI